MYVGPDEKIVILRIKQKHHVFLPEYASAVFVYVFFDIPTKDMEEGKDKFGQR